MADDVLFDDSPIAKYISTVQTRSKKGQRLAGFKIEKVSQLEEEPLKFAPELSAQNSPPLASIPTPSASSTTFSLLGLSRHHLEEAKRDSIHSAACKLVETVFPADSPFSGLRDSIALSGTDQAASLEKELSHRTNLVALLALVPLFGALFSSRLCGALCLVVWPLLLYFYLHLDSERRYLLDATELTNEFSKLGPESAILFSKTRSALQLIQEVELVSRGYRITSQLSPIVRLEQGAKIRRCTLLRREIFRALSSIHQLLSTNCSSYESPFTIAENTSSQRIADGDDSIAHLKFLYQSMQIGLLQCAEHAIVRRLHYSKEHQHCWRLSALPLGPDLAQMRRDFSQLISALSAASTSLISALTYQESWVSPQSPNAVPNVRQSTQKQGSIRTSLLEHLNALQSSLQTQVARIVLCKDQMQQLDEQPESTLNEMVQTFFQLSNELQLQVPTYVSSVTHSLNRLTRQVQGVDEELIERDARALAASGVGSIESADFAASAASEAQWLGGGIESLLKSIPRESSVQERVYEAETGAEEEELKPSALSRAERIAIAKAAREESRAREEEVFAKLNFVLELKDVLSSRVRDRTQS